MSPESHTTTTLFEPSGLTRRERRALKISSGAPSRMSRLVRAEQHHIAPDVTLDSTASGMAGGPRESESLRTYREFRVRPHRATSAVLSFAYPFLAEGGFGSEGTLIGADVFSGGSFCFDPWTLYRRGDITNPNVLLAGVIGTGKSSLAKSMVCRSIAFGRRVYVPGDPKGEWTPVADAVGGQAIALGPGTPNRLNPLDGGVKPGAVEEQEWQQLVHRRRRDLLGSLTETVLARPMLSTEHTALDHALSAATRDSTVLTLPRIVEYMLRPDVRDAADTALASEAREATHALRRLVAGDLAGMFDGESTVRFDPTLPMLSLDLSRINGSDQLIGLVMACSSAWLEAALLDPDGGQHWIVYDEAWRFLHLVPLLRRMQSQLKLVRLYGASCLLVFHRLSDRDAAGDLSSEARAIAAGLISDCSTRIMYRQEFDQIDYASRLLGLQETEQELLPDLGLGEGLWRIGTRRFVVQHQLTEAELAIFDTTRRMLGKGPEFPFSGTRSAGTQR